MIKSIIEEMRLVAQKCTSLSRGCLDRELAQALEEVGVDLATKASELESKFDK